MNANAQTQEARGTQLERLLERTSRTFALTIPLLPEPTRRAVTTAYLLFRIADTFEDATAWPVEDRTQALMEFAGLLEDPSPREAAELATEWAASPPVEHEGYIELLRQTPLVMADYAAFPQSTRDIIRRHVERTALGMCGYVTRSKQAGSLELRDLHDLREYCYVVAGIVGEMLTELFVDDHPEVAPEADYLRKRARFYGEGLQLTNIVKDAATDADEGRSFLPRRVSLERVFDLARRDLELAEEYLRALQRAGAPQGILAFNALPLLLAWATLDRVEEQGPGAKLTRPEVFAIVSRMEQAIADGKPISGRVRTRVPQH